MPRPEASGVAVLVDGDNLPPGILGPLLDHLEATRDVTERRIYRNWRSTRDAKAWDEASKRLAFERVDRYKTTEGKNGSDIAVAVEAVDLFHEGFRAFCIASGDTDFAPLVERLRRGGAHVTIVGHKPDGGLLAEIADEYLAWTALGGAGASKGRARTPRKAAATPPSALARHGGPRKPPARGGRGQGRTGTPSPPPPNAPPRASQGQGPAARASDGAQEAPSGRSRRLPRQAARPPAAAHGAATEEGRLPRPPSPRPGASPRPPPTRRPRQGGDLQALAALLADAYQVALTDGEVDAAGWVAVDRIGMILQSLDREFTPASYGMGSRTPLSRVFQRVPGYEVQGEKRGRGTHYKVRPTP